MTRRPFTTVFAIFLILSTSSSTALAYYNPKLGRFMQRDPVGPVNAAQITPLLDRAAAYRPAYLRLSVADEYANGLNLYQLAWASPLTGLDPMGTTTYAEIGTVTGGIGSLVLAGLAASGLVALGASLSLQDALNLRNLSISLAILELEASTTGVAAELSAAYAIELDRFGNVIFATQKGKAMDKYTELKGDLIVHFAKIWATSVATGPDPEDPRNRKVLRELAGKLRKVETHLKRIGARTKTGRLLRAFLDG